ncbi:MAG: copper homeostasis protein CutC [Pyrinomonadaceae bacterium]
MLHARPNDGSVLEVIACSVEDAVEAEKGGADRLEIIRDLDAGGYTPPLDLVREIRSSVNLPLRVMLREDVGFGLTEVITVEKLCCVAHELNKLKVDGVVLGFLSGDRIDVEMVNKVLSCSPDLNATFHHAFEDLSDKFGAIEEIKQFAQVDRILSHGGYGSERVDNLTAYAAAAKPEISLLAGGRIDLPMIRALRHNTELREFHVGSAARENGSVSAARVEELAWAVRDNYA